ncbi:hypothetical protein [Selenomonas sp. AB3002]|uniref:hypothetical protein n=1 Tax=Selenomonas sp. AB3002 TaxID=1392502 RepID=UPI000495C336
MRLYLDCCCYNRPFDDLSQERVRLESDSVLAIITRSLMNGDTILGSGTLGLEIAAIRNPEKRAKVADLCQVVTERIAHSESLEQRAKQLQLEGLHVMDSFHVASAEIGEADIFLTVDDKLIKLCRKITLTVRVMNPLEYIEEVLEYEG